MSIKDQYEQEFLKKKQRHTRWRGNNAEHVKNRGRGAMAKWRNNNPEKHRAAEDRNNAKQRELVAKGVIVWVGKKRTKGPNWEEYQNQKQRDKYARDEEYRNRTKAAAKEWIDRNHKSWLLRQIKLRAKKHDIPFNLTIEDIVIPVKCPILGLVLKRGLSHSCDESPTLDRVVPNRGYVKGNVAVISRKANSLKGGATAAQHRKIADYMDSFK